MTSRVLVCAAACAVSVLACGPVAAQSPTSTLNGELLKDWVEMKATMMKIAEAMPEEKFSFRSTPAQRDFGQQILHVAGGNDIYLGYFGGRAVAPVLNREAKTKAEILKALAESFDYGTALIKEQTERSMLEIVQTNQFLGPSSRARVIYFLLGHTWDIYGQMAVYLRLNGVVPPRSERP